jgi:predicted transcriptional regulator
MKRPLLWGALACAFLIILLFNTAVIAQPTGSTEGKVYDRYGSPIGGANVSLIKNSTVLQNTTTNDEGYYIFTGVEEGEYVILVKVDGDQLEETVDVEVVNVTTEPIIFNFETYPPSPDDDITDDDDAEADDGFPVMIPAGMMCVILIFIGVLIVVIILWKQYSKITSEKLMDHETRQRILTFLNDNPGGHLRGIKEGLGLSMGVLTHHIYKMEQEEVIKSRMDGKYRRFYPYNYKIIKSPLLTGTQKTIMEIIQKVPGISPPEIATQLGKSRKTVYYHVQELEAKGVLYVNRQEKQYKCFIAAET